MEVLMIQNVSDCKKWLKSRFLSENKCLEFLEYANIRRMLEFNPSGELTPDAEKIFQTGNKYSLKYEEIASCINEIKIAFSSKGYYSEECCTPLTDRKSVV